MPNDSLMQALLARAQTPLVPQSAIQPAVSSLTEPKLDQSPMMARIKGFGAGALEGLRGQTSPLNLAALATLPMGGGAARGAVAGAEGLARVIPEVVEAAPAVKQVMPMADDVTRLAAQLKNRLMQVPSAGSKTLGQVAPEYTAVGGESALNAGREAMKRVPVPRQDAYTRILGSGRGNMGQMASEAGEVNPNLIIGGGAALGGALLAKKLYDAVKGVGDKIQSVNPLKQAGDILDSAAGKRGKY